MVVDAQFGLGDYDDETLVRAALQAAYPEERPIFSQRRGEQIIRAAAVEEQERTDRHPFLGGRVAACLAAAFTLFAGTAGAASAALPGQPLYPIKRVVERAMVAVTTDEDDAARVQLELAERRLEEADAVIVTSEAEPEAGETADSLERQANEHLSAASALGGDEVQDEVDDIREGEQAEQADDQLADSAEPVEPPDEPAFTPEVAPSPSLSPTPSASPSPSTSPSPVPSGLADPKPSASPSPSASEPSDAGGPGGGTATPAPLPSEAQDLLDALEDVGEDVRTSAD